MARELSLRLYILRLTQCLFKSACLLAATLAMSVNAAQFDIAGPGGSGAFGTTVNVLPNGNIVVTDPTATVVISSMLMSNVGAVYLYDPSGVLLSTLTGSGADNQIGSGGVTALSNGNYVVRSPLWDNGPATDAGAVTWANGSTGLSGMVSTANSLIGSTAGDKVGSGGVTALSNGNYVVASRSWNNGAVADVGAVTWANGATGRSGAVASTNSLVGTMPGDEIGSDGVTELSNGNYVTGSGNWDNGAISGVGAVTWADGSTGRSGAVTSTNSLIGTAAFDFVGSSGVIALSNGNYVVRSSLWDNGASAANAGAVTWANGSTGSSGVVSTINSLVGTTLNDRVGETGVTALSNGNYVVRSSLWNNGATADVGAVTWANGSTGRSGAVSPTNSLIGMTGSDSVGAFGAVALSNGNYVVASGVWDNPGIAADVGAVTWANGGTGLTGVVSPANSLIGTTSGDRVGNGGIFALSNGNYVVRSLFWNSATAAEVGAVTWANGGTGLSGSVSSSNSLIGATLNDRVGATGVTELSNGNYVVRSSSWNRGGTVDAGAVTWANGSMGLAGLVSQANSLIGTTLNDQVGASGVAALSNGHYVVASSTWDDGSSGVAEVGAATWANGSTGLSGFVATANSLIGTINTDVVSSGGVTALGNGNYVGRSPLWNNGAIADAGAMTLARGDIGLTGTVLASNSVRGTAVGGGPSMVFGYDAVRAQLAVGRPASNIVSLFTLPPDLIFANGFE